MAKCGTCNGSKNVFVLLSTSRGFNVEVEATCPDSKGTGEVGNLKASPLCNDSKKTVEYLRISNGREIGVQVNCPKCN